MSSNYNENKEFYCFVWLDKFKTIDPITIYGPHYDYCFGTKEEINAVEMREEFNDIKLITVEQFLTLNKLPLLTLKNENDKDWEYHIETTLISIDNLEIDKPIIEKHINKLNKLLKLKYCYINNG